jgi:hypothetical protein
LSSCKFCGRVFEKTTQIGGHTAFCLLNPNRNETRRKIGASREGKKMSNFQRERISKAIQKKVEEGSWHSSFSKSRTHEYRGEKFHGEWEVKFAKWLDATGQKWRRPKEKFEYEFEGKKRFYTPDFFLEEEKKYIEIKGYPTNKDFAKWSHFPLQLEILTGRKLFEMKIIENFRSVDRSYGEISWK